MPMPPPQSSTHLHLPPPNNQAGKTAGTHAPTVIQFPMLPTI